MSVRITLTVTADPKPLEQFASSNTEKMQAVLEAAKRHSLIAHRFFGSDNGGSLMVLDQWPDRQSFESFFDDSHDMDVGLWWRIRRSPPWRPGNSGRHGGVKVLLVR
jgi:hypothetical protein